MKKNKLSDSEIRLLFLLLSLIVIVVSYFFVFQKTSEKAEALEASNGEDEKTLQSLQVMAGQQGEVEEQTETLNRAVDILLENYPSDVPQEKAIWIIQNMEDQTGIRVKAINVLMDNAMGNLFTQASADAASGTTADAATGTTADAATDAATDAQGAGTATDATSGTAADTTADAASLYAQAGYFDTLTVSYEADYASFKRLAEYTESSSDRMTIPVISANYDETTGLLTGTFTVNMYYVTNTGKEYEAPVIGGIGKGVTDIFSTGNVTYSDANGDENADADGDGNADAGRDENGGDEDEGTAE